jgi:hypothetical protein
VNLYDGQKFSEAQVIDSRIDAKEFADYGYVTAVNGGLVDVMIDAPVTVWGEAVSNVEIKGIELLFPVASGLSLEIEVKVGDQVLLLGLRTYVQNVASVKEQASLIREKPASPFMYSRETLKALPMSSLRAVGTGADQSSLYMRAKAAKLQVKNAEESLATVLSDFMDKVVAIATAPKVLLPGDMTAVVASFNTPGPVSGTVPGTALSSGSQSDINAIKTRLLKILEA